MATIRKRKSQHFDQVIMIELQQQRLWKKSQRKIKQEGNQEDAGWVTSQNGLKDFHLKAKP